MTIQHDKQLAHSHDGSWGRQLTSLEAIPLDVVYHVADYFSAEDLRALSVVSRPLRELLSDPSVWKKLYRRNEFLLPPGPYDWQSTSSLVDVLLRAERLHSVWPSSSSCPEIIRTRSVSFGCDATVSVLLGRWLLVAEGPTLVCYDSRCNSIHDSGKTLYSTTDGRRIYGVFSGGTLREDGITAFVVLLVNDSFIIARILIDHEQPVKIQTLLTSRPIMIDGWTDLVDVRVCDRLLVVKVGECPSSWESSDRLVIMDTDTLHRYRIPTSTDPAFDPMHTITWFCATKTHLVKVTEFSQRFKVRFKLECFPLPAAHETPKSDVLYPSHQSRVTYGPKLRECVVIHESPKNLETGKMSFTLFGLNAFTDSNGMEIMEVFLEPDGGISFAGFTFAKYYVTSFCMGKNGQYGCGVGLRTNKNPLVFSLDYRESGSFSFKYSVLDRRFPTSDLLSLDTFEGTAFFTCRSSQDMSIEMVDFTRDTRKLEGRLPEDTDDEKLKVTCGCGECYLSS